MRKENKVILLSSVLSFVMTCVKIGVGLWIGSLAIVSSGLDNFIDGLIGIFNFFILKKSFSSSDKSHNYGHGKLQGIGATLEGAFIIFSAGTIFYEAIEKIINHEGIENLGYGLYVAIFAVILTGTLIFYLQKVYKETKNIIIKADIIHYKIDLMVNIGVFFALIVIHFTGFEIIDPILSIIIALYILYGAFKVIKEGIDMLLDRALNEDIVKELVEIINHTDKNILSYHLLKTRKSGDHTFVEFHIVMPDEILLKDAHCIGDRLEKKIKDFLPGAIVTIRFDSQGCIDCKCLS